MFRVCPTDDDAAAALARYAFNIQENQSVALLYRNDLFGRGYQRTFRRVFESQGGKIISRDPFTGGSTDFHAYMQRVARKDPDGLVLIGGAEWARHISAALRDENLVIPVLATDDFAAFSGDMETVALVRGLRYTSFYLPERAVSDVSRRFRRDYETRFGGIADHVGALAYDATMLLGMAAIEVGRDRARIRDWIAGIGTDRPAFEGVTGWIHFNEWGDAVDKQVFITELAISGSIR